MRVPSCGIGMSGRVLSAAITGISSPLPPGAGLLPVLLVEPRRLGVDVLDAMKPVTAPGACCAPPPSLPAACSPLRCAIFGGAGKSTTLINQFTSSKKPSSDPSGLRPFQKRMS
jgi:hypothetical protein